MTAETGSETLAGSCDGGACGNSKRVADVSAGVSVGNRLSAINSLWVGLEPPSAICISVLAYPLPPTDAKEDGQTDDEDSDGSSNSDPSLDSS